MIYQGDCLEAMASMPDKAFDLAICDPPYGIGKTWLKCRHGEKSFKGNYKNNKTPPKKYFTEIKRVSQNQIIWGANYFSSLWPSKNIIVWDKQCTWEKDRKSECEFATTSLTHRPSVIFRYSWSGARKGSETGITIIHPHQKPVALYQWLLKNYAKPGDKILDTHLGSGSSAIAAYNMGFNFTGYEIDADYFQAAKERIDRHMKQERLFKPQQINNVQPLFAGLEI